MKAIDCLIIPTNQCVANKVFKKAAGFSQVAVSLSKTKSDVLREPSKTYHALDIFVSYNYKDF